MLTPNSSSNAYCTTAQMLQFIDWTLLSQLTTDNAPTVTPPTYNQLLTDPNLIAALEAAAGDIEAACAVAGRYLPSDLTNLITAGGNAAVKLAKLNADLAFASMRERRGYRTEKDFPQVCRAFELLERLRLGERIFPYQEVEAAGVGAIQDQAGAGPAIRYAEPMVTQVAHRYFGRSARSYRRFGGYY